jgi:hypothetical protein
MDEGRFSTSASDLYRWLGTAAAPLLIDVRDALSDAAALGPRVEMGAPLSRAISTLSGRPCQFEQEPLSRSDRQSGSKPVGRRPRIGGERVADGALIGPSDQAERGRPAQPICGPSSKLTNGRPTICGGS